MVVCPQGGRGVHLLRSRNIEGKSCETHTVYLSGSRQLGKDMYKVVVLWEK